MKKTYLRFVTILLALIFVLGSALSVNALGTYKETSDVPHHTFTYWQNSHVSDLQGIRTTGLYDYYKTYFSEDLDGVDIASFNDITIDKDGNMYILDADTSRIHIFDEEFKFIKTIGTIIDKDGVTELNYTGAKGIYVASDGYLYICDTQNGRVIILNKDFNLDVVLTLPDSNLIPDDFVFSPTKITVDSSNYIYVLCDGSYYGAILYSPIREVQKGTGEIVMEREFLGFFGANTVKNTVVDILRNLWKKLTTSKDAQQYEARELPFQFTDLYVDKADFVYTATGRTSNYIETGQVKKLSPGGLDILKSDNYTFGPHDVFDVRGRKVYPDISGLAVCEDNFIYIYDSDAGYIGIYDDNCDMLSLFGGGADGGYQNGSFMTISAIDVTKDKSIIVLDSEKGCITVYKRNEYGKLLMNANLLTRSGDYNAALPLWEQVLSYDRNCQIAYSGIARTYYAAGDYEMAMKYAQMGYDYDIYSTSFEFVRRDNIEKYIEIFAIITVVVIVALYVLVKIKRKKGIVLIKNYELKLMSKAMMHPSEVFTEIKEKNRGSVLIASALIVIYYITATIKETNSGFLFRSASNTSFNSFLVLLQTLGLVLLWTICNWAVCTLFNGKGKMREIFVVTSYSLIPLIISNIVYTIASNVILESEASFLSIFVTAMILVCGFMLIVGMLAVHDYTFLKFLGTAILSIIGILIIIFLGIVVVILVQQLLMFFGTIYREFVFR